MERRKSLVLLVVLLAGAAAVDAQTKATEEKAEGYAEWRLGNCYLVDGQRVCLSPTAKFKGGGDAKSYASIPLGYELKAKGTRGADGSLVATEVEAKPNGGALFEGAVKSALDDATRDDKTHAQRGAGARWAREPTPPPPPPEQNYCSPGRFYEEDGGRVA